MRRELNQKYTIVKKPSQERLRASPLGKNSSTPGSPPPESPVKSHTVRESLVGGGGQSPGGAKISNKRSTSK